MEPVLPFWPNYRLAHPENLLILLAHKIFSGSKYQKNILFNFEKGSTAWNAAFVSSIVVGGQPFAIAAGEVEWWHTVLLFSKLNKIFFGYFDPENIFLDNKNK